jgi:hypothetical protein
VTGCADAAAPTSNDEGAGNAEFGVEAENAEVSPNGKEGTEANIRKRLTHALRKVLCTVNLAKGLGVGFAGSFVERCITSPRAKTKPVALDSSFFLRPRLLQASPTIQSQE